MYTAVIWIAFFSKFTEELFFLVCSGEKDVFGYGREPENAFLKKRINNLH